MRLTFGMPVWENADTRPEREQDEGNGFLRALRVHEDGRNAIFSREAPTAYRRLTHSTPERINDVLAEGGRIQAADVYSLGVVLYPAGPPEPGRRGPAGIGGRPDPAQPRGWVERRGGRIARSKKEGCAWPFSRLYPAAFCRGQGVTRSPTRAAGLLPMMVIRAIRGDDRRVHAHVGEAGGRLTHGGSAGAEFVGYGPEEAAHRGFVVRLWDELGKWLIARESCLNCRAIVITGRISVPLLVFGCRCDSAIHAVERIAFELYAIKKTPYARTPVCGWIGAHSHL